MGMDARHKAKKALYDAKDAGGRNTKPTTLKGILLPVEWDDKGRITAVALSTADEKEYRIIEDEKGKQLISLVREELELTGIVKTIQNNNTMTVVHYRKKRLGKQRKHQGIKPPIMERSIRK